MVLKDFTPPRRQVYLKQLHRLMRGEVETSLDVLSQMSNLTRYLSYGELARILVRYELLKLIKNQSGDIVEFGLFMGTGMINFLTLAELLEPHNWTRRIIGFDTFEGLKTKNNEYGELKPGMYKYSNRAHLKKILSAQSKNKLRPDNNFMLIRGDVVESLPSFIKKEPSFLPALIYLDLDLYGPTKFVLDYLEPFIRPGCVIAFDELGMGKFAGETKAFLESKVSKMGRLQKLDFAKISYIQI
jgi:hypothetical protein